MYSIKFDMFLLFFNHLKIAIISLNYLLMRKWSGINHVKCSLKCKQKEKGERSVNKFVWKLLFNDRNENKSHCNVHWFSMSIWKTND